MITSKKLRVLDLFSGIGGFSLGLERAGGFETVAFCEIEPYCRRVLAKHWPGVPCYEDVRTLTADRLAADGIAVDVICGGFPCQDISFAGKRAGLSGARSGLWGEYRRLIGELRPRFVIAENVPGILSLGLGDILGDLAALRYDACWECIPASSVGAPHRRDRWWMVASPDSNGGRCTWIGGGWEKRATQFCENVANAAGERCGEARGHRQRSSEWIACGGEVLADSKSRRRVQGNTNCGRFSTGTRAAQEWPGPSNDGWWGVEPDVGRVADGVPDRAHRLKALGNSVVPQIPELIGKAIMQAEGLQ